MHSVCLFHILNRDMNWTLDKLQSVCNKQCFFGETTSPCANLLKFKVYTIKVSVITVGILHR